MVTDARAAVVALGLLLSAHAIAHGEKHDGNAAPAAASPAASASPVAPPRLPEQQDFGMAGDPAKVTRTITVRMSDAMRYTPSRIAIRRGETVRFVVRNHGRALHELVIGTKAGLKEHAELMKRFPGMEHDEPNMVHVSSGTTGEIVWQFNRAGEFHFACLVDGHFEAGMVGRLIVE